MNYRFAQNCAYIIFLFFTLSGCSVFSPVKTFTTTYAITSIPDCIYPHNHRRISLLVTKVDSESAYNTNQMVYSLYPHHVAYYAKSGWIETPAQMFQPLIAQTLQNTHYFYAVDLAPSIAKSDYILNTKLLELKHVFYCDSSEVQLRMRAYIINATTLRIIASKEFAIYEPAFERSPYGGVVAANRASAVLLDQLAKFTIATLH